MDISALKNPVDFSGSVNSAQKDLVSRLVVNVQTKKSDNAMDKSQTASSDEKVYKKPVDLKDVTQMTEAMNKFIQAMDAHIRFTVHEKSNHLMVQVVDQANDKVLKEFPASEFLDTMVAIRDYVGILLDKKI